MGARNSRRSAEYPGYPGRKGIAAEVGPARPPTCQRRLAAEPYRCASASSVVRAPRLLCKRAIALSQGAGARRAAAGTCVPIVHSPRPPRPPRRPAAPLRSMRGKPPHAHFVRIIGGRRLAAAVAAGAIRLVFTSFASSAALFRPSEPKDRRSASCSLRSHHRRRILREESRPFVLPPHAHFVRIIGGGARAESPEIAGSRPASRAPECKNDLGCRSA
jgi:hypothetical protein